MSKLKKAMSVRNIILLWTLGIAGQICWNLENQWFNLYVYKNIGPYPRIITGMIICSAIATCFSTFFFGTCSDRRGRRKPYVCIGYILWGIFTILFGLTHLLLDTALPFMFIAFMVVIADTVMSFFGSMGNDSGFSAWTTDILTEENKNMIGTAIAVQPVIGTIAGTLIGGMIIASTLGYLGFFIIMGCTVSLIGVISLFFMKDSDNVKKRVDGSFWHQFATAFNFKEFFRRKELVLVNVIIGVFFIGFNCYFNHIGNMFVYNYGFNEADFGYIEGVALLLSVVIAILIQKFTKPNRNVFLTLLSIALEIIGLLVLTFTTKLCIPNALLSIQNLPLFLGVLLVGIGYILFMQTIMVWAKELYPEDQRGQFEGIRIIFFVLIPMIFGSLISNVLMEIFGSGSFTDVNSQQAMAIPNESLFVAAIIICALALIPLFKVKKLYNERIKKSEE